MIRTKKGVYVLGGQDGHFKLVQVWIRGLIHETLAWATQARAAAFEFHRFLADPP